MSTEMRGVLSVSGDHFGECRAAPGTWLAFAFGGIADMGGLAAGSTRSRMTTHSGHQHSNRSSANEEVAA
jgi:hypothetical protein